MLEKTYFTRRAVKNIYLSLIFFLSIQKLQQIRSFDFLKLKKFFFWMYISSINMYTHILPLTSNNVYIWRNLETVGFFCAPWSADQEKQQTWDYRTLTAVTDDAPELQKQPNKHLECACTWMFQSSSSINSFHFKLHFFLSDCTWISSKAQFSLQMSIKYPYFSILTL